MQRPAVPWALTCHDMASHGMGWDDNLASHGMDSMHGWLWGIWDHGCMAMQGCISIRDCMAMRFFVRRGTCWRSISTAMQYE